MKIENVHIKRRESYDSEYPNMLIGTVQIKGEHGKMEVVLSNSTVAQIFALIKADAIKVAKYNAEQVEGAIDNAAAESDLLPHLES